MRNTGREKGQRLNIGCLKTAEAILRDYLKMLKKMFGNSY